MSNTQTCHLKDATGDVPVAIDGKTLLNMDYDKEQNVRFSFQRSLTSTFYIPTSNGIRICTG